MPPQRKLRLFLSYASQDKQIVRQLYQKLTAEPWIDPWLDEEKLLPGQDWALEIEKAVEDADAVLACISTRSVTKEGYVQKELRSILRVAEEKPDGTIFIIPVRLDDCAIPRRLRDWQYVDFFPASKENASYQRLIDSLKLRSEALGIKASKAGHPSFSHPPSTKEQILEFARNNEFITAQMVVKSLGIERQNALLLLYELTGRGMVSVIEDEKGGKKYAITAKGVIYQR